MEQTSESVLTEERVNEFREAFAIFDKDNDGVISFQELGELMKLLGQTLKDGEINEIQENVDLEKKE